jgi:hypothetical protein
MFTRRILAPLAALSTALVVVGTTDGTALAAPVLGGGLPARSSPAVVSATPCVVDGNNDFCESTYPVLLVYFINKSDTAGCTFTWTMNWDDGSKEQSFTRYGQSAVGSYLLASHDYQQPSKTMFYSVTSTAERATGGCTITSGTNEFVLLVRSDFP